MDTARIREDFKVLVSGFDGKVPIYLDNACQTLRPRQVVEAMAEYYESFPACAGRSVHRLSTEVSLRCDEVRARAAGFFGAESPSEIAFLKNSTEGLNTVILGSGLGKGDEIVTTDHEHNSVHVPVLRAAESQGIRHRIVRSGPDETFDLDAFEEVMSKKVRLVAMCLTSNVNGYTIPAKEIVDIAHSHGARVLLDAAQAAPSMRIDVRALGVDYLAASAHKMCGPSGVGIFYASSEASRDLIPIMTGGHSVSSTTYDSYELLPPPERFEAGLQNYAGVIGTGAALKYIESVGMDDIRAHVAALNKRITRALLGRPWISILEPLDPNLRSGMFSFNIRGLSPHDVAMILDNSRNIMLRSGMHCCHPFFLARGMDGCVRASSYLYNTSEEMDLLAEAVEDLAAKMSKGR